MNSHILKSALISEKSFSATKNDKFTFIVSASALKAEVADVVADLFGVEVLSVNMIKMKGKVKRTRKGTGKRSDFKKAILTLKPGSKIDLFEIEEDGKKDKKSGTKEDKRNSRDIKQEKVSDTQVTVRNKKEMPRKVI